MQPIRRILRRNWTVHQGRQLLTEFWHAIGNAGVEATDELEFSSDLATRGIGPEIAIR